MAEGTIGSFFTKINNEVEKQMNNELHVTNDKVKSLTKKLAAKDLCKKFEKHRAETDQTITGMLSKDETLGLVNVLKKMLKSSEDNK